MASFRDSERLQGYQLDHPARQQHSDAPTLIIASDNEEPSLHWRFGVAGIYTQPWGTEVACHDGTFWNGFDSLARVPFEDVDPNIVFENEDALTSYHTPDNQPVANPPIGHLRGFSSSTTFAGPGSSPTQQTTTRSQAPPASPGHPYRCGICQKTFGRIERLENCLNRHDGIKPHECLGGCGSDGCPAKYGSIEQLKRHLNRFAICSSCGESQSKQNMSRHKSSCG